MQTLDVGEEVETVEQQDGAKDPNSPKKVRAKLCINGVNTSMLELSMKYDVDVKEFRLPCKFKFETQLNLNFPEEAFSVEFRAKVIVNEKTLERSEASFILHVYSSLLKSFHRKWRLDIGNFDEGVSSFKAECLG